MAVGPAVADAEHEVGRQHVRVAVAMAGLQPAHAGHQRMVIGDRAPAHQRRDHRHADGLGELHQQGFGAGVVDAATGDDQRALGGAEHVDGFLDLLAGCRRLVDGERLVGIDVEFDLGHLHVERQVDQYRPRTTRAHHMEGLLEHARHQRRLAHGHRPLGHRLGDGLDVHGLEVFFVQAGTRRLAGDAEDRDGVGPGRVEAGDHVGAGRPRGADAHADVAGLGAGVALGHVRGALDVAGENVADTAIGAQGGIQRVDRGAWNAEGSVDAFLAHYRDGGVDCSHAGHWSSS
ncbi:hypothetical protein C211_04998 [Stutzerimonas degradans]|nr:hypothetical protein C211_04998 [Stutzerimonas degradans]